MLLRTSLIFSVARRAEADRNRKIEGQNRASIATVQASRMASARGVRRTKARSLMSVRSTGKAITRDQKAADHAIQSPTPAVR